VHNGTTDRPNSTSGRDLLCGHLLTLPDNKCVEDIHQPIRLHGKGNVNRKQRYIRIQDSIAHSDVLEQRSVENAGTVTKDTFLRKYKQTKKTALTGMFRSRRHKLPVEWAGMTNPNKTWASWSEDTMQKGAVAWHWSHYYVREWGVSLPPNCSIGMVRWSKLVLPETLMYDGQH